MTFKRLLLSSLLMGFLASCTGLENWFATPTFTAPTETPSPTATRVWFPPSATPTPPSLATQAPTPEMRPGIGGTLIEDDFSDPSLWNTAASDTASAIVSDNHLTLAVQSGLSLLSLRQSAFPDNFYAEVTARPSLCRGEDNYGVLIRADASSYYRFALTCNGSVRAERILNGSRLPLQAPLPSADVPPGAPGEVRIGIWAFGRDIRLFLNGKFQFSISEPALPGGSIGFFVRSAGNTAVIVSFEDLIVQEIYK